MCGIAGLVRFDGGAQAERTRGRARAMRTALRHRGPDGEGEALLADAILEHTRLALLDPQPIGQVAESHAQGGRSPPLHDRI